MKYRMWCATSGSFWSLPLRHPGIRASSIGHKSQLTSLIDHSGFVTAGSLFGTTDVDDVTPVDPKLVKSTTVPSGT